MTTTSETLTENMVRFQCYITKAQHEFLKVLAQDKGVSGGYVVRKGISLYAKRQGVELHPGELHRYR